MIEFTNISIEGFGSVQELNMPLNNKGITVIRGANGFGKTSIFTALVWALYGKNLKGNPDVNTWPKFRPKGYRGTKVEVFFKSGTHVHSITRCLKYTGEVYGSKGGNRLIYNIDGDTVSERGKKSIQDLINQHLGMSYSLFINSVMFGQGLKRLIQESGANQREIFEEVFDLGYLTRAKKIAQEKYAEYEQQYHSLSRDVENTISTIRVLRDSKKVAKENLSKFEDDKALAIGKLDKEISSISVAIKDSKAKLKKMAPDELKSQISTLDKMINSEKKKLELAKRDTGISLEELIDKTIELLRSKKYKSALSRLLTLKNSFNTQESSKQKILQLREKYSELQDSSWKVKAQTKNIEQLEDKLKGVKRRKKDLEEKTPDFQAIISDTKNKIAETKKKLANGMALMGTCGESRDLYRWAYTDPLGNLGIKSYLFESSLSQLNDILGSDSSIIGFSIQFQVDLNTARKDFKTIITVGDQKVSYEDLSGGQKQLTNLAMAFSMNTLIAQAQGTNIAFLDEVFESLSEDNIEVVINLIRKIYQDKTLFLITHQESLPIPNARVLRVKYNRGISQYEW